jgi:hypothetical protein
MVSQVAIQSLAIPMMLDGGRTDFSTIAVDVEVSSDLCYLSFVRPNTYIRQVIIEKNKDKYGFAQLYGSLAHSHLKVVVHAVIHVPAFLSDY